MPNFVRRPRGRNNPRSNGRRPNANFRNSGSGQIVSLGETGNNNNFSRNRNGNRGTGMQLKCLINTKHWLMTPFLLEILF